MRYAGLATFLLLVVATAAGAQVLTTADTVGRAKNGFLFSDNHIFVDGATLHIVAAQYVRGLNDRFDLYLVAGDTRTDNDTGTDVENQAWLGAGGNWTAGRWKGFSVSVFGIVSMPINRRNQASDVLANPAVVVSRTVVEGRLALYTGINALVPIGHAERGWFTPTTTQVNVPAGALIILGKWGVFAEGDIGHLKAFGAGLSRTF
jgi:hypothetical protein